MDNSEIELVGGPCGHHGPYTFYKAFKYSKNGSRRIISLCEFFFVKLWSDSDLVCIGELQLLWVDKNSEQMLASLRLYFLPENTPEGRMDHGEDEVLAISEKVVLRLEDLLTWITVDTEWTWGKSAFYEKDVEDPSSTGSEEIKVEKSTALTDSTLDFSDVEKERRLLGEVKPTDPLSTETTSKDSISGPSVIVLSYPRYCRYRALMKRLEGVEARWLRHSLVAALGGFTAPTRNTRVLFCRDTFDYPDLEGHELLCNHLAPKLKGRPRGKRKKRSISPGGSESNESESSVTAPAPTTIKTRLTTAGGRNGLRCNSTTSPRRSTRSSENVEERDFLNKLHTFMKSHRTPIGRIPSIGYKEIDLYALYTKVQKLGGYDSCTANRMWKPVFDELGGHHNSTSAATIMRRHYERLLLAFERHIKGEEYKPLPVSERRRLKSKTSSFSDAETSEGDRSNSGNSTPIPASSVPTTTMPSTPSTPSEIKEFSVPEKTKTEGKVSSLRSVRVKPERLRDAAQRDKPVPAATPEKPNLVVPNTSSLPEKNSSNVPVTSAVAPVVEKSVPEKSVSPLEGKENIPVMNMTETNMSQTRTDSDDEPVEIPYKPPSPEIIDLDAEPEPSLVITGSSSLLYDVKKRKLDILKEGGLEVTAITGLPEPASKDGRPSVIQHSVVPKTPKGDMGNLSITVTSDSRRMPPPVPTSRSQSPKKALYGSRPAAEPQQAARRPAVDVRLVGAKLPTTVTASVGGKPLLNGNTPPKVVQSKSIYSYSERTVYGNPKDSFMPPPATVHTPRHLMRSPVRTAGGEVLDLTVKSPQKPIVEIMRVPSVPLPTRMPTKDLKNMKGSLPGMPLIDARVGSNLEITLVSGNKGGAKLPPVAPRIPFPQRPAQKRSSSGRFVNSKPFENGRPLSEYPPPPGMSPPGVSAGMYHHRSLASPTHKNGGLGLVIPTPQGGNSNGRTIDLTKMDTQALKQSHHGHHQQQAPHQQQPPQLQQNSQQQPAASPYLSAAAAAPLYISQLAAAASKSAAYLPMLDPLYYSALCSQAQGLYPPAGPHMYPPVPTMDQLQLYKDLMAHSARNRFPFPLPADASAASMTAVGQPDNPNLKK